MSLGPRTVVGNPKKKRMCSCENMRKLSINRDTWLVVWNIFYCSIYWEQSSQLTFIFFRGIVLPPARIPYFQTRLPEGTLRIKILNDFDDSHRIICLISWFTSWIWCFPILQTCVAPNRSLTEFGRDCFGNEANDPTKMELYPAIATECHRYTWNIVAIHGTVEAMMPAVFFWMCGYVLPVSAHIRTSEAWRGIIWVNMFFISKKNRTDILYGFIFNDICGTY
jgi:hypothetical protein